MISCILLAAGLSRRFGSPKALALLNGSTVIHRLQTMLLATRVGEVIVVLGANAEEIKLHLLNHSNIKSVYNKNYNLGQTSSFQTGLRAVSQDSNGVLLLPVDYPLVREKTINALIERYLKQPSLAIIPSFQGKKGHPPLFAASLKDEFLALGHHYGINKVAQDHQNETTILPVEDAGVVSSFNTLEELEAIRNLP
ncbi:MAG TPA: nucleotidyltransferase family protein [Candidatus Omnitrophota bacterium]|nr:nucleotidyltransferase family protein [Candidatus Omnitrophota bacterium]